ncbi:MAG: glycosyltransferase [bacterium]|nr:glycosyltransferase [bacterium]
MKVLILPTKAVTGKGKFQDRLALELHKQGVTVTRNVTDAVDIVLHVGRVHFKANAKKSVLRVGPTCVDSSRNYKKINKEKWKSIKKADAIIYQSKYSKKVYRTFVGREKCPSTVIFNGADPAYYENIPPQQSPFKYNFLTSTRKWLPQKRLKQTIKAFKEANVPDSCLWIAGKVLGGEKKYKCDNIRFVGLLTDDVLGSYYKLCDAMIHMVYLDASPNSVVEAMVAGCPVICTDQGGTIELTGWGIKDKKFKFKPINLNKPPDFNRGALSNLLLLTGQKEPVENAEKLYISNITREYINFFERVLGV